MTLVNRENLLFGNQQRWLLAIFAALFFSFLNVEAAPTRYGYQDNSGAGNDLRDTVESLRHQVANHESEIRVFEERFKSQEEIIDALSAQFKDSVKTVKANSTTSNQDLNQQLADSKKRIANLEKSLEIQTKNLDNMQKALTSLIEAIQGKEPSATTANSSKVYRVKSGDSLEKIAKQNHTTIKKLKELNNLTSDQIIIGQKIELPDEG